MGPKLYDWQVPRGGLHQQGKAGALCAPGVKVGIAGTLQSNLILGARAFRGNPYDGHTLNEQLDRASILMLGSAVKPALAV